MTCNASDLVNAAKCYCFPKGMAGAIQAWLLCKWAQIEIENPPPPCEFSIALDGPGRVILSWGNPVVYDLIEVWHAPLFGPRHLETTLPGTDTSWTTPILAPGDYFIIRGKIGDDYSGFAVGDTCPPVPPTPLFSYAPASQVISWVDSGGPKFGNLATFYATAVPATVTTIDASGGLLLTSMTNLNTLPLLSVLRLQSNAFTTLDVTGCSALQDLRLSGTIALTSIVGLNTCSNLVTLIFDSCNLSALNASSLTSLAYLDCNTNPNLASVTVNGCTALAFLDCHNCNLGTLNITGDFAITTLDFSSNPAVVIIGP